MRTVEKVGTIYRGGQGQWAFAAHRISGALVFFFLMAHILDTALVGFGPKFYNRVVGVYHNPVIRLMEIGLAGAVLFHALNGLRIMAIDFFPKASDRQRELLGFVIGLFMVLFAPAVFFMGRELLHSL
ncbi:MAG: succinate dehydrogenase, cytochrome b556 subunit [Actinomycetota bacterium]|nr:succinate dehydrogenase, cytochrome b556 subunit [Actinomycetota bacterium]